MSDVQRPPDDELVSAYLDGEATPAERALVEGDPELLRQVDELRQVSQLTRATAAPTDAVREANIAAALAVFDAEVAPTTAPFGAAPAPIAPTLAPPPVVGPEAPEVPGVVDLGAARRRRGAGPLPLLAAAAAVVIVVVIAAGLLTKRQSPTDTAALAPAQSSAPQDAQSSGGSVAPRPRSNAAAGEAAPSTTLRPPPTSASGAAAAPSAGSSDQNHSTTAEKAAGSSATYAGDLGPLSAGAQFRNAMINKLNERDAAIGAGRPPASVAVPSGAAQQLSSCDAKLQASDHELGPLVLTGKAVVNGKDAYVLAYEISPGVTNANGAYRAFLVTPDCTVLDTQTI